MTWPLSPSLEEEGKVKFPGDTEAKGPYPVLGMFAFLINLKRHSQVFFMLVIG